MSDAKSDQRIVPTAKAQTGDSPLHEAADCRDADYLLWEQVRQIILAELRGSE